MSTAIRTIRTSGSEFLGPDGKPLLLRGVCLGGWLNMENFITGYSANETLMRREVREVHRRRPGRAFLRAAAHPRSSASRTPRSSASPG